MKKRILLTIGAVVLLVSLFVLKEGLKKPEKSVMQFYELYIDEMRSAVERHFEKGEPLVAPDGASVNEWPGEHTVVEYIVKTRGIVSSSQYYGVFYSCDNTPVSFQNAGVSLTKVSDTEWKWQGKGDNHGYVRQIEPYWFYYEAGF
ncbi:MAG: hypothetical protein IJL39_04455 [Clostridia bacterium]|nr:hypothetical protein [Clostridia bacterium]